MGVASRMKSSKVEAAGDGSFPAPRDAATENEGSFQFVILDRAPKGSSRGDPAVPEPGNSARRCQR